MRAIAVEIQYERTGARRRGRFALLEGLFPGLFIVRIRVGPAVIRQLRSIRARIAVLIVIRLAVTIQVVVALVGLAVVVQVVVVLVLFVLILVIGLFEPDIQVAVVEAFDFDRAVDEKTSAFEYVRERSIVAEVDVAFFVLRAAA